MPAHKKLSAEARERARADLRALIDSHYNGNAAHWARAHGFTEPFVSMVLNGKRPPSQRILEAMRLTQ
jgi:hypothetical protein